MNIIKLYGGLGNQMFQYAFGKAMEQFGTKVAYDLSWFNKPSLEVPRPYGLGWFRLELERNDTKISPVVKETEQDHYHFRPQYLKVDNSYFFGYWQHQNY